MAYKIFVSPRAQQEIESAIDYYASSSKETPLQFIISLKRAYDTLTINPFFSIQYKSYPSTKTK